MMKKILYPIGLLILVSCLFLFPLFKPGFYNTHDGENHVARLGAYYNSLSDGQIPARWSADLNYKFGSPVLNFFYPLPGYIGSLFHFLGFGLQDSVKLVLALSFILAPISFFIWSRKLFTTSIAFASSLFYGLAPYHFLDLYVRGDIGEIASFVFAPLVLWAI